MERIIETTTTLPLSNVIIPQHIKKNAYFCCQKGSFNSLYSPHLLTHNNDPHHNKHSFEIIIMSNNFFYFSHDSQFSQKTDTPTGSPVASSPISSGSFTRNSPGSSYAYPPTMSPVSSKSEPSSPSSPGGYFNGSLQPFDIYSEYNDKVWKEGFLIKEGRLVKSWKKVSFFETWKNCE